jgi:hypothetical protein
MILSPDGRAGRSARAFAGLGLVPKLTLFQLSVNTAKLNNTFAAHSWLAADLLLDELGSWSSNAPTRLYVPPGITRARFTLQPQWASTGTSAAHWAYVQANGDGTKVVLEDNRTTTNESATGVIGVWLPNLLPGDYFEILFAQTTGSTQNLSGSTTRLAQATKVQIEWAP